MTYDIYDMQIANSRTATSPPSRSFSFSQNAMSRQPKRLRPTRCSSRFFFGSECLTCTTGGFLFDAKKGADALDMM